MLPNRFNKLGVGESTSAVIPLTLTATQVNSTVKLTATGSPNVSGLQFRTNTDKQWTNYTIDAVITLSNVGDFVQFQNTQNTLSTSVSNYVKFVMTGKINGSGSVQSMLNYSAACNDYCYYYLFYGCTSLLTAPDLPSTVLASNCYRGMFNWCTSLVTAPELPASVLATSCYQYLFRNCTSLTTAPELSATNLA